LRNTDPGTPRGTQCASLLRIAFSCYESPAAVTNNCGKGQRTDGRTPTAEQPRRLAAFARTRVGTGCQIPDGYLCLAGTPRHPRADTVAPLCPKLPVRITELFPPVSIWRCSDQRALYRIANRTQFAAGRLGAPRGAPALDGHPPGSRRRRGGLGWMPRCGQAAGPAKKPFRKDECPVFFLTVLLYVERNPLRAGLVRRAQRWRWSSLRWGSEEPSYRFMTPKPGAARARMGRLGPG
jgi:hypothetical protein